MTHLSLFTFQNLMLLLWSQRQCVGAEGNPLCSNITWKLAPFFKKKKKERLDMSVTVAACRLTLQRLALKYSHKSKELCLLNEKVQTEPKKEWSKPFVLTACWQLLEGCGVSLAYPAEHLFIAGKLHGNIVCIPLQKEFLPYKWFAGVSYEIKPLVWCPLVGPLLCQSADTNAHTTWAFLPASSHSSSPISTVAFWSYLLHFPQCPGVTLHWGKTPEHCRKGKWCHTPQSVAKKGPHQQWA